MIEVTLKLTGTVPMSQNKYHNVAKEERELSDEYEERTWRHKMHTNQEGYVVIPALALKNCLAEAAKYLSGSSDDLKIKGKGKSTYTKSFEAGVMVLDAIDTGVKADEVEPLWLFVPADGQRGGKKRVLKAFPQITEWAGTAKVLIFDEVLNQEVVSKVLDTAGKFIGLGSLRVRNNGINGRFNAEIVSWNKV